MQLSGIGANMLKHLKARFRRRVAPAATEPTALPAPQLDAGQQNGLLQFVLDNMAEGVIVCDRDRRLVQFNHGAALMAGADLRNDDFSRVIDEYKLLLSRD